MANTNSLGSKGEALIKKFEGCRLTAYDLGDGMVTIGWGHAEPNGQTSLIAGVTTWSQAQADDQFYKDIAAYVNAVNGYFIRSFNRNQFDAMVSFTYNTGTGVFARDNWDKNASDSYITESLANYINKGTIFEEGLRRRRQEEINLFNTPVSGSEEKPKEEKGEITMQCTFNVSDKDKALYYFDGQKVVTLTHTDQAVVLRDIYKKNNGKDMPHITYVTKAPFYERLIEATKLKAL